MSWLFGDYWGRRKERKAEDKAAKSLGPWKEDGVEYDRGGTFGSVSAREKQRKRLEVEKKDRAKAREKKVKYFVGHMFDAPTGKRGKSLRKTMPRSSGLRSGMDWSRLM